MAKNMPPMKAIGISSDNDKATGKFNLTIHGAARDVTAVIEPMAIPTVTAAMLTRVMERRARRLQRKCRCTP